NEIVRKEMNFEFEKQQAITEAKHKNEIEKKQTIAQEKSRRQNIIILSVAIVLFLVLTFAVFIYKSLSIARKQKNIIEHQKHMIEEKHKEITDSINYAERIQRSFLATKHLLDDNLKNYFVFFQPKDVVSGDFYWASKLNNGQFALATADSTGHGVPGAIMSILNISSLEKAIESDTEPNEILNKTREIIIKRLKKDGSLEGGKDGMDCSLICFDFKNNIFTYSAANNPIWIIRNSELIELAADKMPVGKHFHENTPFAKHSFIIQKGDLIYTLTDGMPDQFGGLNGKKFKYKQLKELLLSVSSEPIDIQYQKIKKTFYNWKGNLEQVDDVTIIGIQI
ncbi:MAG: SpoIIE family protein phosphatase, partial [Bacteroidia bacterium]|nr:SpoIIE family protein phosphatase [Bacteroidia bacterium]